jgi:ferredoxin
MDGIGNRVAASIFGPFKVIFVIGQNKITPDLESARQRIKDIAAPRRARELKMKPPCAETGKCIDCSSPVRICRAEVILHRAPSLTQTNVIIVEEDLGT